MSQRGAASVTPAGGDHKEEVTGVTGQQVRSAFSVGLELDEESKGKEADSPWPDAQALEAAVRRSLRLPLPGCGRSGLELRSLGAWPQPSASLAVSSLSSSAPMGSIIKHSCSFKLNLRVFVSSIRCHPCSPCFPLHKRAVSHSS